MENALLIKLLPNNMQMSFILSCSKLELRDMLKLQETQEGHSEIKTGFSVAAHVNDSRSSLM